MMKTTLFAILILCSSLVACNGKEKTKDTPDPKVDNRDMKGLKIAYYNSDSLKVQYLYFKNQEEMVTKKQKTFQSEVQRRSQAYQNFIMRNNEKLRSGQLSENQQMQIQQSAQQMEASLMQYQQTEGAKIEQETVKILEEISKKIESYGKEFSEEHNIDILLINGPGGQINFINSSMDVTKEFTSFLNQREEEIEKDIKK